MVSSYSGGLASVLKGRSQSAVSGVNILWWVSVGSKAQEPVSSECVSANSGRRAAAKLFIG